MVPLLGVLRVIDYGLLGFKFGGYLGILHLNLFLLLDAKDDSYHSLTLDT